ncbi:MAG: hypothetical protein IKE42_13595 [Aquamicrobium sp.]|jgi:hypothetical protein|uniref:AAA family ATPase n=1 Tax=Mesorhizobium TaxID=68287 RepID=UPI0010134B08|nr:MULTISPECIES: AAA family ATPase [Mesorhizobium]MBR2688879.1 hypothetical protein [Aquamicrobium sp.]QAZ42876.1 hypothetical protein C1M53_07725 [Mesorhizobium sp. Pch-S]
MFILLNGSFGIGKTTVAELLVRSVAHTALYDPEDVGYVLRRLPPWALGMARQPADYQDLSLWRWLIVHGARRKHRRVPVVVVPMAFTNRDYFETFAAALGKTAPVHKLCLVAPLETVRARLMKRATLEKREISEFELRRSLECVEAHRDAHFGVPIDATVAPDEIIKAIRRKVLI